VTLYEALTGARPFPDGDESAGALAARYPQLELAPVLLGYDLLPPLREVVHACLDHDPARRPLPAEISETLEPLAALLPLPRLGRFRPGSKPSRPPAPAR
jgi:eukaryotic-like serine/threonine-protein kinase